MEKDFYHIMRVNKQIPDGLLVYAENLFAIGDDSILLYSTISEFYVGEYIEKRKVKALVHGIILEPFYRLDYKNNQFVSKIRALREEEFKKAEFFVENTQGLETLVFFE